MILNATTNKLVKDRNLGPKYAPINIEEYLFYIDYRGTTILFHVSHTNPFLTPICENNSEKVVAMAPFS